jgi:hypothetical protein
MNLAGLLLLVAGWVIVLTAIGLLPPGTARAVFVLAAVAVEALGLILVARSHLPEVVEDRPQERD